MAPAGVNVPENYRFRWLGFVNSDHLIHLTYNHVVQRLLVFAVSNFVLVALWMLAGFKIFVQA